MTKQTKFIAGLLCCIMICCYACTQQKQEAPSTGTETTSSPNTFTVKGSVREIFINHDEPEFPEKEGKDEFTMHCATCHTLRYITTQPNFTRKTWDAEINKMITKFHAPIDSITVGKILDYLVAVKGKK